VVDDLERHDDQRQANEGAQQHDAVRVPGGLLTRDDRVGDGEGQEDADGDLDPAVDDQVWVRWLEHQYLHRLARPASAARRRAVDGGS
jgi:hypothetical protein